MTWHYALGAVGTGLIYAAPFLYAAYRTSPARSRRLRRQRQKGSAR